jgi:hypothetical protein
MIGHILDRQHLAEFVDVKSQPFCDPLAGREKLQVFDNDLSAVSADNLAVTAMEPDSKGGQIQISNRSSEMTVDLLR